MKSDHNAIMRIIPIGESRIRAWYPGSCLAALLAVTVPAAAQFGGVATNLSLDRPTDSRSIALGESFVAVVDDIAAIMYNPAGLAWGQGIAISYAQRNDNIININNRRYMAYNVTVHTPYVDVGLTYSRFNQGESEISTESEPDGTGIFVLPYEYTFGIGLARSISEYFSAGVAVKAPDLTDLYNFPGTSFTTADVTRPIVFDIGILYRHSFPSDAKGFRQELGVGMSFQNVGAGTVTRRLATPPTLPPNFYPLTSVIDLPQYLRAGFAYRVIAGPPTEEGRTPFQFLATAEYRNLTNARQNSMRDFWGFGVEASVYEILMVRIGGYGQNEITNARYGAGLRVPFPDLGVAFPLALAVNYAAIQRPSTWISDNRVMHVFSFDLHYNTDLF
jgi:hypothetical protein